MIVGTDSHTCTYGAFGAFSAGIGTTDLANVFATGDIWIEVPETYRLVINGQIKENIMAKDLILFILKDLGENGASGKVIEFSGSTIKDLSMEERMTLSNMVSEMGAICGFIEPDEKTVEYLKNKTKEKLEIILPDKDADYALIKEYDVTQLIPQVAKPYSPANVEDVKNLKSIKIDKAYIGACTGGKLVDLKNAAIILKNKKISEEVKLYVVPGTLDVKKQAEKLGYLDIFRNAGATILPTGCGACINCGIGYLKENEVGIFATNRNFIGRNGHPTSKTYLASPRTVAISAIKGYISDSL
jgi:homoaconitase/3-isopropylmalate dehydratase large subunit